jgi:toxin FitB
MIEPPMYLIDTNVISEARKSQPNSGVTAFFKSAVQANSALYLSVVTIGELRRGVERLRHRNDSDQAILLDAWMQLVLIDYAARILDVDVAVAEVWGRLRVPQGDHPIDKLIAATALTYDLTVVTRNVSDFKSTRCKLLNPFI